MDKFVDLRPPSTLFVSSDVLKTAQELQDNLAQQPLDNQPEMAAQAIELLGDPRELLGSHNIYVHALGTFVLANGLSEDDRLYHGTYFGDAYLGAYFSRFGYVQHQKFRSISLILTDVNVIKSSSNPEFEGETLRSGVFVPVHAVESTLAA